MTAGESVAIGRPPASRTRATVPFQNRESQIMTRRTFGGEARVLSKAMADVAGGLLFVGAAGCAARGPPNRFASGVSISLLIFRHTGVCSNNASITCTHDTEVTDCGAGNSCALDGVIGDISQCEEVFYQAFLNDDGNPLTCAFSGGTF